mgnify:FL=1
MNKDITKTLTLSIIEDIVEGTIQFNDLVGLSEIQTTNIDGYNPDFTSEKFKKLFIERLEARINYIKALYGHDILPVEAAESIEKIIKKIRSI